MARTSTLMEPRLPILADIGAVTAWDESVGVDVVQPVAPAVRPDPEIVVALEARHGQAMFGFVRRLGLTDDRAQDCVQEALVRLWAELVRGTRILDPKAWAFRTVYRLAMDEHRLRRRMAMLVALIGDRATFAHPTPDASDPIDVWREVDRLPLRQRQVLYLRYRADLTFEEIGAVLGVKASAARSHATQATNTLRKRLLAVDVADRGDS